MQCNRRSVFTKLIILIALWATVGLTIGSAYYTDDKYNVLVLNSYHKGYKWTDNIVEGIMSVLGPRYPRVNIDTEDMDTKRISDPAYLEKLYEFYKYKYAARKYDVIICSDDTAFQFLLANQDRLFPGIPVVFCGVNYFEDSMLVGRSLFTGVVEIFDIKATVETMRKIHPDKKNVYVINDNTITGQSVAKMLAEVMPEVDGINFIPVNGTMEQVENKVSRLPPDSMILFLVFFEDAAGKYYSYDESIRRISASSSVPVYGVWDFNLGRGIVGGMLTSGYHQGRKAAELALRILEGEKPDNIPVVKEGINCYAFDKKQMLQFGIKNSQLPENSIIINETYSDKKQVLVLNSYDPDMTWVKNIGAGIQAVLGEDKNIAFYYDYMDLKRNPQPEYTQQLYQLLQNKYSNKKFDVVLASDDGAYNFLLAYHQQLFPDTPAVFCGVNNFKPGDIAGRPMFTGVVEAVDIKGTIDVALRLHPRTKQIVVINDKTPVGEANKKMVLPILKEYLPKINFVFYEDMNMSEIEQRVSNLDKDTVILLLTFNQDKSNNVFTYEESAELISKKAQVPVYGVWDFYLGHGVVGGMMTSGYTQGEAAAKLAKQILNGRRPADMPVILESPNRYMFDYNQLVKFGVDYDDLPAGSIVVNKPAAFYELNRNLVWSTALVIIVLAGTVAVLSVNIRQRKKAEAELRYYATTDTMTGVFNRRTGLMVLEQELAMAERSGNKLCICFVDIDNLKTVNDTCGHDKGDELIIAACQLLKERVRKSDIICRMGGDEFLIILPMCSLFEAHEVWERIEERIDRHNAAAREFEKISLSYGFAQYDPENPVSFEELINTADKAMYAKKKLTKKILKEEYTNA